MTITYRGELRDARILASSGVTMRVAVQCCDDTVELSRLEDNWFSEEGEPVSFEFLEGPEIPFAFPEAMDRLYALSPGQLLGGRVFGNALRC